MDARVDDLDDVLKNVKKAAAVTNSDTLTEHDVTNQFAARWAGHMLFCHDQGKWFAWSGAHWKEERTQLALDRARAIASELSDTETPKTKAAVRKASFAAAVERLAKADRAFAMTADRWDANPFLLGTPAGTVDLRTGLLRPASTGDYITRVTACAPAERAECPIWLGFLHEATNGDAGFIRLLQQWAGYSLTGDTREHALIFVYGPGGNGKSVFLDTITGIAKDYSVTAAMDTFTASLSDKHPTDLAMLRGARMVSASETEEGRAWAEARIKQMTGGDQITARFMRQDFFTFTPAFKLIVIGNHKPVLKNIDDAARRRFNIAPFVHKPAVPDRTLAARLREEWPAILRWMIEGCLDWQKNGLVRPKVVLAETEAYFNEQDLFGQWIDDECDAEPGNRYKSETSAKLFESFSSYIRAAGESPPSKKSFGDMMQRKGFDPSRGTGGVRSFQGVRLRPREDDCYDR